MEERERGGDGRHSIIDHKSYSIQEERREQFSSSRKKSIYMIYSFGRGKRWSERKGRKMFKYELMERDGREETIRGRDSSHARVKKMEA